MIDDSTHREGYQKRQVSLPLDLDLDMHLLVISDDVEDAAALASLCKVLQEAHDLYITALGFLLANGEQ
jgi:hypothetical protein